MASEFHQMHEPFASRTRPSEGAPAGRGSRGAAAAAGRDAGGVRDAHAVQRELVLASLAMHPYPREERHALRP